MGILALQLAILPLDDTTVFYFAHKRQSSLGMCFYLTFVDFQRPNMRVHPDQTPYPANLRPSVLCPPCIIRTPSSESLELTARTCWGYAINASTSGLTPRLETGNSSVSGSPGEETPSERSLSSLDWSPVDLGPYECGLLRLRQRSRNEAVLPRTLENRGLASGQHTGRQAQMMHTPAAVES